MSATIKKMILQETDNILHEEKVKTEASPKPNLIDEMPPIINEGIPLENKWSKAKIAAGVLVLGGLITGAILGGVSGCIVLSVVSASLFCYALYQYCGRAASDEREAQHSRQRFFACCQKPLLENATILPNSKENLIIP